MLHSPEAIQKQLSDAVSIIGRHDFPNKWPDLISQMVEKFATGLCRKFCVSYVSELKTAF